MLHAIGEARVHLFTAEVKVRFARVAHRPAADPVVQVKQAGLVGDFRARLGRNQAARRRGRNGGLLVPRTLTEKSARTDRDNARTWCRGRSRVFRWSRRGNRGSCARRNRSWTRCRCGTRRSLGLGRLGRGGGCFLVICLHRAGACLQAQAVRLADHGIAADPAQFIGDLAGGCTAFPHLGQLFDPFFGPAHDLLSCAAARRKLANGAGCG